MKKILYVAASLIAVILVGLGSGFAVSSHSRMIDMAELVQHTTIVDHAPNGQPLVPPLLLQGRYGLVIYQDCVDPANTSDYQDLSFHNNLKASVREIERSIANLRVFVACANNTADRQMLNELAYDGESAIAQTICDFVDFCRNAAVVQETGLVYAFPHTLPHGAQVLVDPQGRVIAGQSDTDPQFIEQLYSRVSDNYQLMVPSRFDDDLVIPVIGFHPFETEKTQRLSKPRHANEIKLPANLKSGNDELYEAMKVIYGQERPIWESIVRSGL